MVFLQPLSGTAQVVGGSPPLTRAGGTLAATITRGTLVGTGASKAIVTPTGSTAVRLLGDLGAGYLRGSGTNGSYDARISDSAGGSVGGHGVAQYRAAIHQFLTYDGSEQFEIGYMPGAAEFWLAQGGIAGQGGTFYATNASSGSVDGNFATQGHGSFWFGTGSGTALKIADPGAPATSNLVVTPGTASTNATYGSTGITQVDGPTEVDFSVGGVIQGKVRNELGLTAAGNYPVLFGSSTSGTPGLRCEGSTNTGCWIRPSGTGGLGVVDDEGTMLSVTNSSANTIADYLQIRDASSTTPVLLQTGGGANLAAGSTNGSMNVLSTSATVGFLGIPTMAGMPTGTPVGASAGVAYLVFDTTDNKLCVYVSAWKCAAFK
jgi:hypothetical protein